MILHSEWPLTLPTTSPADASSPVRAAGEVPEAAAGADARRFSEAVQAVIDHAWDYGTHNCGCGSQPTDSLAMAEHDAYQVVSAWEGQS